MSTGYFIITYLLTVHHSNYRIKWQLTELNPFTLYTNTKSRLALPTHYKHFSWLLSSCSWWLMNHYEPCCVHITSCTFFCVWYFSVSLSHSWTCSVVPSTSSCGISLMPHRQGVHQPMSAFFHSVATDQSRNQPPHSQHDQPSPVTVTQYDCVCVCVWLQSINDYLSSF